MTDLRAKLLAEFESFYHDDPNVRPFVTALIDDLCELREALAVVAAGHANVEEILGRMSRSDLIAVMDTETKIAREALAASDARLGKFVKGGE